MTQKRIALIPAYEPDEKFINTTVQASEAGFDVIVVNDGSSQDKDPLFSRAAAFSTVLTHSTNQGKGAALKTGLSYIKTRYGTDCTIVTLDADGQHAVSDAVRVAAEAEKHPDRLILGSRKFDTGKKVPLRSRLGNAITRMVFRMGTGLSVYDTQTGLRAFSGTLAETFLTIPGDRYEYEMNMLLCCSRRKIRVEEIPIKTIYLDDNRSSHFNVLRDSFRIYKEILKFGASSFLGFLVDYGMFGLLSVLTAGLGAQGVVISNIGARVVSASVNFTVNRRLVFHSRTSLVKSALQYFSLAACILIGNTFLLNFMVNTAGINRYLAKIVTEITFFVISWTAQKFWIFRKKEKSEKALPDPRESVTGAEQFS